jgi:phosphocarrier protein
MLKTTEVGEIDKKYSNPVAELVQLACRYDSHIMVQSDGKFINAKSLMGMMAFGLKKGIKVEISAEGSDETDAADAIESFLSCN